MTGDPNPLAPPPDAPREGAPATDGSADRTGTPDDGRRPRLLRRRNDRMIGGVAGGLADYLDADPALVRIAWVAVAVLTSGLGVLAYLAAWVLVPEEGTAEGATATSHWQRRAQREHRPWGGVILGLILIVAGGVGLLGQLDIPAPPWRAILAVALVLLGLGILTGARRGLNGGLLVLAILVTAVLASEARVPIGKVDSGFGDRQVFLDAPDQIRGDYSHAFGAMRIDLTDAALSNGTNRLDASIAFGDLRITVPAGVGVRVNASTAFGSTRVLDEELGAFGERDFVTPGYDQAAKRLELDVTTTFGSTRVSRGQP